MMVYPPRALGVVVRAHADALDLPYGEYISSVLAEHFGHPYWAAAAVRLTPGGLQAQLENAHVERPQPAAESWAERDLFVARPVKALGDIVRDAARNQGVTLTRLITDILAAFHGVDLEHQVVLPSPVDPDPLRIERQIGLREEVQRLLA